MNPKVISVTKAQIRVFHSQMWFTRMFGND